MPTVSTVRQGPRGLLGAGGWILLLGVVAATSPGCVSRGGVVTDDVLEPMGPRSSWLPSRSDLEAVRLARAAMVASPPPAPPAMGRERSPAPRARSDRREERVGRVDPRVERALDRLLESTPERDADRLVALGTDLRNATLDDPIADRDASRALRRHGDPDPRLEGRLDRAIADDPLRLARRRGLDGWHRLWARSFNAVAEPLGSSAITGFVLAPYQLANSFVHYLAEFSNAEPLSLTERQALAHRKQFVAAHPGSPLVPRVQSKIDAAQVELEETLALRRVRAGEAALDARRPRRAKHHASAARRLLTAHPDENDGLRRRAEELEEQAAERLAEIERLRARSLDAEPTPARRLDLETRLAARLLAGQPRLESLDPLLEAFDDAGGAKDAAEYVRATLQVERGFEVAASRRLGRIASRADTDSSMARHADALLTDDWQNPYGAFERLRAQGRREEIAWRLAGEWVRRPRYPNLPAPVAYLIDAPTIAITIVLAPLRLLISPWTGAPDFQRPTALAGYRYLHRRPDGDHQRAILDWLYDYEQDREHWDRALRLADVYPDLDPDERGELVEKAARARLDALERLERRDYRASVLEGVAQEFPDSQAGHDAGLIAREERADASAQHIRITRDFLRENPEVAGREGIGLNPRLLDEDPGNGELHPEGVVLRGGRLLEVRLIADGGDEDDPPESNLRPVSPQRLARIAGALDEAVRRNGLVDVDARHAADSSRDVYLERAGLGVTEDVDLRPTAESRFVYRSLRERYGLVRGRESVLPVDLVFRGSLGDFSLGAFPRWRPPRRTPDAFLYR